ncbi:MAG: histidine kinase [Verrucomicrobia bacterium]|nr:histidine kinase [Verrucomicrobiota bacterium]
MRLKWFTAWAILAVAASAVGLSALRGETGLPSLISFSSKDFGAEATGWSISQGSDGVIYFGCNTLLSYDGERWKTNPIKGGYALRGLDFGADGKLWVAAVGDLGWFERSAGDQWNFHSLKASLPAEDATLGDLWHVFAFRGGAVFVSANKILFWTGTKFTVWPMTVSGARRLHAMRVGEAIYVHRGGFGIYQITEAGPVSVIPSSRLAAGNIFWMEQQEHRWLVASSDGLYFADQEKVERFAPEASALMRAHSLTSAVRLRDGRLAIGTYSGGLILVRPDGSIEQLITEKDGIPTQSIYSLAVDRDGALWATSNSHIMCFGVNSSSSFFGQTAGLPKQPVRGIVRSEGLLTVATDKGIYQQAVGERAFQPIPGLEENYSSLLALPGELLCTGLRGITRKSSEGREPFYVGNENVFLAKPSTFRPGSFLISEGHTIVLADANGHGRVLVKNLPDVVLSIAEDAAGTLWLGTIAHGVLTAKPLDAGPVEAFRTPAMTNLVAANEPAIVGQLGAGNVVVLGNRGGWLFRADLGEFQKIAGYPARGATAIAEAAAGESIWTAFSSTENIAATVGEIRLGDHRAVWQPHFVEGLETVGNPRSIFAESAGARGTVVWIGGMHGIVRDDVPNGQIAPQPRAPLLAGFSRTENQDSLVPITASLPYSTRSIVFEFAEPEFAMRPSLRLETRIDGIDEQWIPADVTSRRELTAVRDGRYVFHVRAVASTGVVSDTTSFGFEVTPPWWRTTPALAAFLLSIVPLGFGAYSLRIRTLRRHNAELEEKVAERTDQLAQASAAKTQFVANMSHDIRNPLNGIVGLALALEDTTLDPRQRELVATLRECSSYLSTLVDDVLDFASIEAGRVELRPAPFVPAELLRSVVATLRADAATRDASLSIESDGNLPAAVLGDPGRIQQVLVNYVSNALKYAGGRIHLSAGCPVDAPGEIEFAVTDEGAGIDEADQPTLFTKFHRLADAQQSSIKGSGLGLASCRLLADLMGGSVGVASKPGHGARFFLRLPLTMAAAPAPAPVSAMPNTSVLLVEDADYNAWAASAVLAKLGLTCERARTGAEAVRMFSERRFNVVLLDRNLPDMDGTEVARKIRALEEDGPRAILLAVTAYCTAQDRTVCLEAGMDAFVGKPLTPAKLRKILVTAGRRLLTAASMHVSPDATSPVLDVSLLDYISDGTDQGLADQVERFLDSLAEGDARLARAAHSRDFRLVSDAAHFLLSQAKLVGCAPLEEAALMVEQAADARDAFVFGEMAQRVSREVQAVTAAMRRTHPATQTA